MYSLGDRNAAYESFLEDLQKAGTGECRYGLFDFEYTHQCQGTSEVSNKTFHLHIHSSPVVTSTSYQYISPHTVSLCLFALGTMEKIK